MRRPFIAGNWKMNLLRSSAVELARQVAARVEKDRSVDVAVCPPYVYLDPVREALAGSAVRLGAQNVHEAAEGAYTGEVSTGMLLDVGCRYVILGHSERRHLLGETDDLINRKLLAVLAAGDEPARLTPIVCVGELLEEREAGRTEEIVGRQIEGSLAGVDSEQAARLVIAYEPVWAIGTGKVATPEQAEEVHNHLRKLVEKRYTAEVAQVVPILYGGSVKPDNAAQLLSQPNVDGGLIGGASLKADDFLAIVDAAARA